MTTNKQQGRRKKITIATMKGNESEKIIDNEKENDTLE